MSDWEAELDQEPPKTTDNKNKDNNVDDDDWEKELTETQNKVNKGKYLKNLQKNFYNFF
jgi:hypothetical protein